MRLVLFTGKGGAGKTTMAAATAVHASRCGLRSLVLSADPAHSLAGAFGQELGHSPRQLEPKLFGQQIDPRQRGEQAWEQVQPHLFSVLDQLGVDPLAGAELTELPGVQEILTLLAVCDQVRSGNFDLVVMDCPPSAETLRLLSVPSALNRYLARLLPMERRIARIVGARQERTRSGLPMPSDAAVEAAETLGAQLRAVDEVLRSDQTSVRLVMTPESVVLSETRRTWTALALHGHTVDEVIANRVLSSAGPPADQWRANWARSHHRVLAEAKASFAPIPLRYCDFAACEPVGAGPLGDLAVSLLGPPSAAGAAQLVAAPVGGERGGSFDVRRDREGFVLRLPVPSAHHAELDLGRRGDDLVVTYFGQRRVLALPSALQRCVVQGATLRDGALAVRFVPDPQKWRREWLSR